MLNLDLPDNQLITPVKLNSCNTDSQLVTMSYESVSPTIV